MITQRALGPYSVSAIGMGCMPLSFPHDRSPDLINKPDVAISVIYKIYLVRATMRDLYEL
jgi:hypothetical protein